MKLARRGLILLLTFSLVFGVALSAYAADANSPWQSVTVKLEAVHGKLLDTDLAGNPLAEPESSIVDGAKTRLQNVYNGNPDKEAFVRPLLDMIDAAAGGNASLSDEFKSNLFDLTFSLLMAPYDKGESLPNLSAQKYKDVLNYLAALSGTGLGDADLGYAELTEFIHAVEDELLSDPVSLLKDFNSSASFDQILVNQMKRAVTEVAKDPDIEFARVLKGLAEKAYPGGQTGDRMADVISGVINNFYNALNSGGDSALAEKSVKAILYGYIRTQADLKVKTGDRGNLTPQLVIGGIDIPNRILDWKEEHPNVTFDGTKFVLSGNTAATFSVEARETLRNGIVYRGEITLRPASSGGSGGGGGSAPNTPASEEPAAPKVEDVQQRLDELTDQLDQLPPEEQAQAVREVSREAAQAVKEAAKATVNVNVEDGVAKPDLNADELVGRAAAAKRIADELNEKLETVGARPVQVELTIDLGTVEADVAEIPLDADLISRLADAGVDRIAIAVNGAEIVIPPAALPEGATLNLVKKPAEEAEQVTDRPIASDVYEFEFAQDGNAVSAFAAPIELRIPVNKAKQFDTDLLTLAKIEGDQLIFYVGIYDPATGTVNGLRDGLSSYVVVENKVAFDDIAPVERWAGRSIEVAAAKGIIVGDGKGNFRPRDNVTRAEFVKMLVSALSLYARDAKESFADVEPNHWYYPYVTVAVKNGVVADGQLFNPNRSITREEMAAMIGRALVSHLGAKRISDADAILIAFSDAELVSNVLKRDVAVTVAEGVMVGSQGKLNPKGTATRAEAAVVIKKLLDLRQ